jgi:(p)ppGpp synthase/HD superfamily hydrolase
MMIDQARAFAHAAHAGQRRKNAAGAPYVSHCAEVARLVRLWGGTEAAVAAAWLHDVVEDCAVPLAEIEAQFGAEVAGLVQEMTDDKALPKAERKRLQIANAHRKSPMAALIKLADTTTNLRDVGMDPPVGWDNERRRAYVTWAEAVVDGLPEVPQTGLLAFRETAVRARLAIG